MAASPYDGLAPRAFWRTAVARRGPGRLRDLHVPRFPITRDTAILTVGSCFAQHVHRAFKDGGLLVVEEEPAPKGVAPDVASRHFYGVCSARWGNIYTSRHFRQLLDEAAGAVQPAHPAWTRDGRIHDAQRPNVDPGGFASDAAMRASRSDHLKAVTRAVRAADAVILTLGLTETWEDKASGTVYPTAPGVLADPPSAAEIGLLSLSHDEVVDDLLAILARLRTQNAGIRLLLTVAPGPLVATAGPEHVLVASTAGKAILRAAVDTVLRREEAVDYFPSYEIITNPAARGAFLLPNLRAPTPKGISVVLSQFLAAHGLVMERPVGAAAPRAEERFGETDAICEELLNDPGARK